MISRVMPFLATILLATPVLAKPFKAEVTKVSPNHTKVLISTAMRGWLAKGDVVKYNDNCFLEVDKKSPTFVLLKTQLCQNPSVFKAGDVVLLRKDTGFSPKKISKKTVVRKSKVAKKRRSSRGKSRQSLRIPKLKSQLGVVAQGFRLGLAQSLFDGELEKPGSGIEAEDQGQLKNDFGIFVGYSSIKKFKPGWGVKIQYSQFDREFKSLRYEANAAVGVTRNLYLFGGANVHQFTEVPKDQDFLDAGLGFQAGAGVQFTPQFGMDLSFVRVNNQAEIIESETQRFDYLYNAQGVELNLHGTF